MTKLLTAIAAATALLVGGSMVGTAKAVPVTDVGTLRPISKSNTEAEKVYYVRRHYRRAYRGGYGYGYRPYYGYASRPYYGYGYRPYGYGYGYRPYGYGYGWRPGISIGIGRGWGWGY